MPETVMENQTLAPDRVEQMKALAKTLQEKSPQTLASLQEWAKTRDVKLSFVLHDWDLLQKEDVLKSLPEDQRIYHGTRILKARYAAELMSSAKPYRFFVLDKTGAKTYERTDPKTKKGTGVMATRASVIGYGAPLEDDGTEGNPAIVRIALYDDQVKHLDAITVGKTYDVKLTGGLKDGQYDLGIAANTHFNPKADVPLVDVADWLTKHYQPTPIANAESAISRNPADKRLFRGTTTFGRSAVSKGGNAYGRYAIVDDSVTGDMIKAKRGSLSVMCDPDQVRWGNGSELLVLGQLSKSDDPQYGPTLNADVVVATFPVELPKVEATNGGVKVERETNVAGAASSKFDDF